ncbi:e3 ubiquitin-protein ligase [Lynx pardinus]|uniref:E3 ubiquitin-protein ligase n=1 Tax=Lynx pardinus TaxID=191816 RepID=A0A485P190_LYNPA|nr:e3 ubiquitin-protein ligase [Lynx pardinus]
MQTERQRILKEFNEMKGLLDSKEKRVLQKLEEDKVNVLDNLVVARDQLDWQRQYLRGLISHIEHQIWGSSEDMLQDLINVMRRSESWILKRPNIVSKKPKSTSQIPDLKGTLQVFKELTEVQRYWVDVMLKPVNAILNITISADQRYNPQFAFWVIGLQNESGYKVFEESSTFDPKVLPLCMTVPPRIGVFLDYEAGIVSFFNITNHGSLIYEFSRCQFFQTTYPYFNPWNCPGFIILCPPSS